MSETRPATITTARGRRAAQHPHDERGEHHVGRCQEASVGRGCRFDPGLLQGRAQEEGNPDREREAPFVPPQRVRLAAEFP